MQAFTKAYLERLLILHHEIQQTIAGLPQAALDWKPGAETNSISVLVMHIAGAERYWIGEVGLGLTTDRDRPAEFQVYGLSAAEQVENLEASYSFVNHALQDLKLPDLEIERISPRDGRVFTLGWVLIYALEHTATHLGHLQLTRQLWEAAHLPADESGSLPAG